jgi:hypothetical protein
MKTLNLTSLARALLKSFTKETSRSLGKNAAIKIS